MPHTVDAERNEIIETAEYTRRRWLYLNGVPTAVWVIINKVGGGTCGEMYAGRWEYYVFLDQECIHHGDDLNVGYTVDHDHAGRILIDFLNDELRAGRWRGRTPVPHPTLMSEINPGVIR